MIDIDAIARGFHAALVANAPYEPPSASTPLDLQQALAVQRAFNELRGRDDPIAGFKAAVNGEGVQRALGLAGPITGALFSSGARHPGTTVRREAYRNLLVETELGFRLARRIDQAIASIDELRAAVATVSPMFELADPGFGRVVIRGTDMIAANAACGGFVEGAAHSVEGFDVNAVNVSLSRDGALLHEARAAELMGDQWQALLWLVNTVVGQGQPIEVGQLLMTGALGAAHAGLPGRYSAVFSSLGRMEITVI